MNKVFMSGRLTRDPEIRRTPEGTTIGRYTLAVQVYKDSTSFFDCVTFGKTAEFVEKYLTKGTKIIIAGALQSRSYQTKDGQTRTAVEILVSEHEFAEAKTDRERTERTREPEFVDIPDDVDDDMLPF